MHGCFTKYGCVQKNTLTFKRVKRVGSLAGRVKVEGLTCLIKQVVSWLTFNGFTDQLKPNPCTNPNRQPCLLQ
jgi:predicted RNase H-related nuclease YkuK (DUF458 family)